MTLTDLLSHIFEEIANQGALIVHPATEAEINECNDGLKEINCPSLPKEYIELLKAANGFEWFGSEFFGTNKIIAQPTGNVLRDIVTVNKEHGLGSRPALKRP